MRPSFVQVTALVLSSISFTLAFDGLSFPMTVAAGKDALLQVSNDLSSGSSFDSRFDSFRVYLAISPPGWGTGPACYLANSSAIATTELTLQIPASVGPDGSAYSIATMEFNQDPDADGPSGFEYSNNFTLSGGTGEWTKAELAGQTVGDPDNVPCTAYNCARNCSEAYYPANVNDTNAYEATYNCTAACPGVAYLSWADMLSEGGSDASSALSSSTEAGTHSTASSGTASSTSKATTTSSSTSSRATASTIGGLNPVSTTSTSSSTTPTHSASAGSQASAVGLTLLSTVFIGVLAVISL